MKYLLLIGAVMWCWGCNSRGAENVKDEAPPPARVEQAQNADIVKVDQAAQFPLAAAAPFDATPSVDVTGVVSADVSRTVPVISLASGRVVAIYARLGDTVRAGQLLMRVQSSDIASAFADYRKSVTDETLARAQYERSKDLKDRGAIPAKDLEVAQDVKDKATVDVETATERLRVLGADIHHPSALVDVKAPVSGVITEQNVTNAAGVKTLDNSPNLFTISDLSRVWVICDVYENDLPAVHLGEAATIRLNAFPDRVLSGRISNIGSSLDASTRAAKVRIEVPNPGGLMRLGMFVTASFHGLRSVTHATVPATAVLHLHDRDWVFEPSGNHEFRRVEVASGKIMPGNLQEIVSGISPGDRVVSNALSLQSTVEQ